MPMPTGDYSVVQHGDGVIYMRTSGNEVQVWTPDGEWKTVWSFDPLLVRPS